MKGYYHVHLLQHQELQKSEDQRTGTSHVCCKISHKPELKIKKIYFSQKNVFYKISSRGLQDYSEPNLCYQTYNFERPRIKIENHKITKKKMPNL